MNIQTRNDTVAQMLRDNAETRAICAKFRLTRQRVHQIAKAHGLTLKPPVRDAHNNRQRITHWYRHHPGTNSKECALHVGLCHRTVRTHMNAIRKHICQHPPEPVAPPPLRDKRARLEAIREWFWRNPGGTTRACSFALRMHENTVAGYVQMLREEWRARL